MQFNNPRYQGKPLLRLLECYVLWAIDRLPAESKNVLEEMTPKLQKTYKKHGTWQEVLAEVMEFTPDMPEQIQSLWKKNLAIARVNDVDLSAERFAEAFVDQNLA